MAEAVIIVLGVILLAGLLYHEKNESGSRRLINKVALSALFVLAALVQVHPQPAYSIYILIGLVFCLAGDACLAMPQARAFLLGLVAFLIGHVFYTLAFIALTGLSGWKTAALINFAAISFWVFYRLRPRLGNMMVPVLAYVVVITAMLCGAWVVLEDFRLGLPGRVLVFAGATLFYLSDIFVARDRFVGKRYLNRLIGLPLYYGGQFLLAFSTGRMESMVF
jgi:uncharacterized membrane protein YhhN